MKRGIAFFILFSALAILYAIPLGRRDLWEPDEPRHGLMSQEVLDRGISLYPSYNGEPMPEYGPFYFWLGALFSVRSGEVTTETTILPTLASALGILILVYFFGKALSGPRLGFLAAAVLASTPNFYYQAQTALIDMLLAFGILLTHLVFYTGYRRGDRSLLQHLMLFGALSLAWLAKGPVSCVLIVLPVFLYLSVLKDWKGLKEWGISLCAISLAISVIWFGGAYLFVSKEHFLDLFWKQTMGRFLTAPIHPQPFYYFLISFPPQFLPWFLLVPFAFLHSGRRRLKEDDRFLYPLCWFIAIFLFFSIASGKRRDYLLPLFPAAALFAARGLEELLELSLASKPRRIACWIMGGLSLALGIGFVVEQFFLKDVFPEIAGLLEGFVYWATPLALVCTVFFFRGNLPAGLASVFVLLPLLSAIVLYRGFPLWNENRSWKDLTAKIKLHLNPATTVVYYQSYRESFPWFGGKQFVGPRFGYPEELENFLGQAKGEYFIVVSKRETEKVKPLLKGSGVVLEDEVKGKEYTVYSLQR